MEIGEKVTLQCDAKGKPEPDVVWALPDPDELTVSGHVNRLFTLLRMGHSTSDQPIFSNFCDDLLRFVFNSARL